MKYPVSGNYRVSSPYGMRTLKGQKPKFHDGIDFAGSTGDSILAVADGVVTYDQDDYDHALRWIDKHHSAGNMVIVQHTLDGKIYYVRYLHIIHNNVSKGDKIKEGDRIGTYGDCGYSFGAHLHLDMYDSKWKKIDPTPFLEGDVNA